MFSVSLATCEHYVVLVVPPWDLFQGEASWELLNTHHCSVEGQDLCQSDRHCTRSPLSVFHPLNYSNVSDIEFTVENQ